MSRFYVHAEENRTEVMIDFRVNVASIDTTYSDNSSRVKEILSYLNRINSDSTAAVSSVEFCGAASPEGPYELNRRLAGARAAALEKLIRSKVQIPDSVVSHNKSYIPWEYLRRQVLQSDNDYKDVIISIIDEEPVLVKDPDNGKSVDRRIVRLKQLDKRHVWNELSRLYFSKMRNASAVIITHKAKTVQSLPLSLANAEIIAKNKGSISHSLSVIPAASKVKTSGKPFYMAISTNMLYDVLAIPNLGAEFYLGKNWSAGGNWMYAWWSKDSRHRYWRAYGGDIHAQYWFGKAAEQKPLSGHHVGVYAQIITYDFEFGGKGYLGDRWTWGAGLSYGYSLPLSRHFNIDFSLGLGYLGGKYKKYHPEDNCYVWESTHRFNWFGPTKAEVSLVWHIGNWPLKKGGVR